MASIPIEQEIEITSGDDKPFSFTIANGDGVTDADYTGWFHQFTVSRARDEYNVETSVVYQLKSTDASSRISVVASGSPLVTSVTVNHFAREAAANTSTPLEPGTYYFDYQMVSPAGIVQTWHRARYRVTYHVGVDVS